MSIPSEQVVFMARAMRDDEKKKQEAAAEGVWSFIILQTLPP